MKLLELFEIFTKAFFCLLSISIKLIDLLSKLYFFNSLWFKTLIFFYILIFLIANEAIFLKKLL